MRVVDEEEAAREPDGEPLHVEPRWPIAAACSLFIVVTVVLRLVEPHGVFVGARWLVPGLEIALLVVLIAANPTHLARRVRWLRPVSITLIGSLAVVATVASIHLIVDLVRGSPVTESASSLLASGATIWIGNALVFGLLYWELDSGGPLARYRGEREHPDFAFCSR